MSDTTATPSQQITLGVTTDVGSVAGAVSAVFKAADDLFAALNTPAMIQARKQAAEAALVAQADADLKAAQASGNISTIDKEASG